MGYAKSGAGAETEPFGGALAWWPDYSGERTFRVTEPKLQVSCVSRLGHLSLPGGFTANMAKPWAQATITAHQLNLVSDSIYSDHKGLFCKSFVILGLGKCVSCLPPPLEEDPAPFASLHSCFCALKDLATWPMGSRRKDHSCPVVPVQMVLRWLFGYHEDNVYTSPFKQVCIWAMNNRNMLSSSRLKAAGDKFFPSV